MDLYQVSEPQVFAFSSAVVQLFRPKGLMADKAHPRLYVQAFDAYAFQRELILQLRHRPGYSSKTFYELHVYQHPDRRLLVEVSRQRFEGFVQKFLKQVQESPDLLFNTGTLSRPLNCGFVMLCERLHRGGPLTKRIL